MKLCCRCKIPLTIENGYLKKSGLLIGKFSSYCKRCNRELNKEWGAKNPEKVLQNSRNFFSKNHEKVKEYHRNWSSKNRAKLKEACRNWKLKNPDKMAGYARKAVYGLSQESFDGLVLKQKNKCAICFKSFSTIKDRHVDHCHVTKKIRGLLCRGCNQGLGNFKDSFTLFRAAEVYLKSSGKLPELLGEGFACSL